MRGLTAVVAIVGAACTDGKSPDTAGLAHTGCTETMSENDFWMEYTPAACSLMVDQCHLFTLEQCEGMLATDEGRCLDTCQTRAVVETMELLASDTAEDCQDLPAEAAVPYCDSGE